MYQRAYADTVSDSPADARAIEWKALNRAVALLEAADATEPYSDQASRAIGYTTELWGLFIRDLARPDNDLPSLLRAHLMKVGVGIMMETQRITAGASRDFRSLAEICGIVRDGLA